MASSKSIRAFFIGCSFLFLFLFFISSASAMLEIGTSERVRGIVLDPPEAANGGTGFATNGTINTTFLDLVYKRLDSGNGATGAWDQGGNDITNIGALGVVGQATFRVASAWQNLFSQDGLRIDCSNSYCGFTTLMPVHWGGDTSNPDMQFDNQSGQFTYNRPVNITQGLNANQGSNINLYSPSSTLAARLGAQNGYTLLYAINNLVIGSDGDIGINSQGISTNNASVLFTSNRGISAILNGTNGRVSLEENFTINDRFNVSEGGAIRATSLTTSGAATITGGISVGTSVTPSGLVALGSAVNLFSSGFFSGFISDGSVATSISNIVKKTDNNILNGTINITRTMNFANANITVGANQPGLNTVNQIVKSVDLVALSAVYCNMTFVEGVRVNSTNGDCG